MKEQQPHEKESILKRLLWWIITNAPYAASSGFLAKYEEKK
jgi:hypothetical protein